jgi:hypothetical protein
MSLAQSNAADRAIAYAEDRSNRRPRLEIMQTLARAFWCPKNPSDFDELATDSFGDVTVRFACLINLQPGGAFTPPRSACSILVRIKYFIRAGLYSWARTYVDKEGLPLDRYATFIYSSFPSADEHSP